jgi:2-keto-3-deoxy-6-phosphogluconate aldolase
MTTGDRSVALAVHAEFQGALGVVLNKPSPNSLIRKLKEQVDIPVTVTIVSPDEDIESRLDSGVDILNVSGAEKTPEIIKKIRTMDKKIAIIATGGKSRETIMEAIKAGANAISYTPPSTGVLFKDIMEAYRNNPLGLNLK